MWRRPDSGARRRLRTLLGAALTGLAADAALAQTPSAQVSGESVCCVDAGGHRVCSDLLPPQCAGRAYKVYNQQGLLVREVAAPLSAEEKAARAAAERREKEAIAAQQEQRRRDQALLQTYASVQDIDRQQMRAEAEVTQAIAAAEARIAEASRRRQKFAREAEFYPRGNLPPDIAKGLRDEDVEIRTQTELAEAKKRELAQIRAKYAEDRKRFLELTRRSH